MLINTTAFRSPNYSPRPDGTVIDALVLHTGEGTRSSDLAELCRADADPVSAHYYVCRDGTIYQLVDESELAYHAGAASYAGITNWNARAIGIETEHKQGQNWPIAQVQALYELCVFLISRYPIQVEYTVAHRWIATPRGRKQDPTDWPDETLRPWIANLFRPALPERRFTRRYRVKAGGATIRTAWWREATNIVAQIAAGAEVACDEIKFGETVQDCGDWLHLADGRGFVIASALEALA